METYPIDYQRIAKQASETQIFRWRAKNRFRPNLQKRPENQSVSKSVKKLTLCKILLTGLPTPRMPSNDGSFLREKVWRDLVRDET